jgi:hypothetical protein
MLRAANEQDVPAPLGHYALVAATIATVANGGDRRSDQRTPVASDRGISLQQAADLFGVSANSAVPASQNAVSRLAWQRDTVLFPASTTWGVYTRARRPC